MNSEWFQWIISMAVGAGITWGVLQSRLTALETDVAGFKDQLEQIRDDVRDVRNYLLGHRRETS